MMLWQRGIVGIVWLAAVAAAPPARIGDEVRRETLIGIWEMKEYVFSGNSAPAELCRQHRLVVSEQKLSFPKRELFDSTELTYKRDAKAIDCTAVDGTFKGEMFQGIYRLDDQTLTLCFSYTSKTKRPDRFEAPKGTRFCLMRFVRVKK
jgi:uncharacterized protein (TIGR03067 family)